MNKCQVLVDKSASGKTRDWAKHKYENRFIALAYKEIDKRKAERMESCANWLAFVRKEETLRLHSARFCRVRLCPVCQWRRSLKTFAQMSQVLSTATSQGYQFIFLTLTVKLLTISAPTNFTHTCTAYWLLTSLILSQRLTFPTPDGRSSGRGLLR